GGRGGGGGLSGFSGRGAGGGGGVGGGLFFFGGAWGGAPKAPAVRWPPKNAGGPPPGGAPRVVPWPQGRGPFRPRPPRPRPKNPRPRGSGRPRFNPPGRGGGPKPPKGPGKGGTPPGGPARAPNPRAGAAGPLSGRRLKKAPPGRHPPAKRGRRAPRAKRNTDVDVVKSLAVGLQAQIKQLVNEVRQLRDDNVKIKEDNVKMKQQLAGLAGGTYRYYKGGAANYQCLPRDPQWGEHTNGSTSGTYMYGAEYQMTPANSPFLKTNYARNLLNNNVPCAVCHVTERHVKVMIPARKQCPVGWTREYGGYLTTSHYNTNYRATFECMDYINGWALTCVVCTK
ncbi:hypothetical protein NP493_5598g00000, partial [Ridgeia piscesae]